MSFLKPYGRSYEDLKRVSSTQFKALSQGLPTTLPRANFWHKRLRVRHIGEIRLWVASLITTLLVACGLLGALTSRHSISFFEAPRPSLLNQRIDPIFQQGCADPATEASRYPRENAALMVLARNSEIDGVLQSMQSVEYRFNQWFNYPWVFLNNDKFDDVFKAKVRNATKAQVEFGYVGKDMWGFPEWISDVDEIKESIAQQGDRAIMYGGLETYHHMCRFFSGFFFNHPLLLKYEWYWRVEPEVEFFCDLTYDPFRYMRLNDKVYGFNIAIRELVETVPNMFRYASAWKRKNDIPTTGLWDMFLRPKSKSHEEDGKVGGFKLPNDVLRLDPVREDDMNVDPESMEGETYNMCHFWSNFEIASLKWFRSARYKSFFDEMDHSGGFWRERWGDAPIHSLAAGLLLEPEQVHYFRDIGYQHTDIMHCPFNAPDRQLKAPTNLDGTPGRTKWDLPRPGGVGCRCKCPTDLEEVEFKEGSCFSDWARVVGGWDGEAKKSSF